MTAPIWRQGRRVGHHIYQQTGPEPSDDDRWIGSFVDPTDAARAIEALAALRELVEACGYQWESSLGEYIRKLRPALDRARAALAEAEEAGDE